MGSLMGANLDIKRMVQENRLKNVLSRHPGHSLKEQEEVRLMNDGNKQENPVNRYIAYLRRMQRIRDISILQLHQLAVSREVAREYGLTEEQINELDKEL